MQDTRFARNRSNARKIIYFVAALGVGGLLCWVALGVGWFTLHVLPNVSNTILQPVEAQSAQVDQPVLPVGPGSPVIFYVQNDGESEPQIISGVVITEGHFILVSGDCGAEQPVQPAYSGTETHTSIDGHTRPAPPDGWNYTP